MSKTGITTSLAFEYLCIVITAIIGSIFLTAALLGTL